MARFYEFIVLIDMALLAGALIDCLCADRSAIRGLPRVAWILIILALSPVGAIAWFVAGRPAALPVRLRRDGIWRTAPELRRTRFIGPDDDPEFLRTLDAKIRRKQAEPE